MLQGWGLFLHPETTPSLSFPALLLWQTYFPILRTPQFTSTPLIALSDAQNVGNEFSYQETCSKYPFPEHSGAWPMNVYGL